MQHLTIPPLSDGETYIGAIGNKSGEIYHLILLEGESAPAINERQIEWAKFIGGDLPNKLEAMMLFVHAKDQFKPESYWTGDIYVDRNGVEDPAWAWYQYFHYGGQYVSDRYSKLRARAVRRLPI